MSGLKELRERIVVDLKEVVAENKENILDARKRVMKLEQIARRQGLLALEYEAEFLPKETPLCDEIAEMIELVVSGIDPKLIEEILTIQFFSAQKYTKIEAVLYFLYARSMLLIQAAASPWEVDALFHAMLPEEGSFFYNSKEHWKEERSLQIEEWKHALEEKEKNLLHRIEKQLNELSEEEWQTIAGNNGFYGFERILLYLDEKTKELVRSHMNAYRYYVIENSFVAITNQELVELQKELEAVISWIRNRDHEREIMDELLQYKDEEIQAALRNIDIYTLTIALKGAKDEVVDCFLRNLSPRFKEIVMEDLEYMGPLRVSEIQEKQKEIMTIVKGCKNSR